MKILIATDTYRPTINGVVTSTVNLKTSLEQLGHEVRLLTLSPTKHSYVKDNIYYLGSFDIGRIYPNARIKIRSGKSEINDIVCWQPDVIHTQSEFSTFSLAKKIVSLLSIPIVHTYHTKYEDYTHYFSPNKQLGRKAVIYFTNYIAKHTSTIIAPTNKIYSMLDEYGVKCPIKIVPSGISLEKYQEGISSDIINSLKLKLNIPSEHFILLSVSRIGKEKNIDELIHYMENFRGKNISLVIVGGGPYKAELERLVIKLNLNESVKFTGMLPHDDMPKYYQMANIFVSASTSETQGLTYIEALASGTPLLCKKDDCLDGVLVESKNGCFYNSKEEFIQKVYEFAQIEKNSTMITEAKQSSQKYSKLYFAHNILEIYQDLICKTKRTL